METVVFLDSGMGGLPYCGAFIRSICARNEMRVRTNYVADRANFPYGKKTKDELLAIITALSEKIIQKFAPKIIVLACNTASVSALADLRLAFRGTLFAGTVPAIKPAARASKKQHIAVLGTERTISESYLEGLADEAARGTNKKCRISKIAAPELVEFVENKLMTSGETEKQRIVRDYVSCFRALDVDGVVLGCTHFLFLLDEFKKTAAPDINIYDSIDGVCRRVRTLLGMKDDADNWDGDIPGGYTSGKHVFEKSALIQNTLYVTGDGAPDGELEQKWKDLAPVYGLDAVELLR